VNDMAKYFQCDQCRYANFEGVMFCLKSNVIYGSDVGWGLIEGNMSKADKGFACSDTAVITEGLGQMFVFAMPGGTEIEHCFAEEAQDE